MSSIFSSELEQRLLSDYNNWMCHFPSVKSQVDTFLNEIADRDHRLSLLCMYAYMPEGDVITYPPSLIDTFVISSLKVRQMIPYAAGVAPVDFLTYVMHYRVNDENIEESREFFFEQLYPRVKGMTISQAALEVNYWCFEKATYCQADGRTASPLTLLRRTKGRCGEESTLCTSALRAVGIPARQVYVPWWAHTEGNHAWVEFQTEDGTWKFLGACEPEPVLNKGWFTVPGSRSMNMIARAYTKLLSGDNILEVSPISQFINCTSHYTPVKRLTIRITKQGQPAAGLRVSLKVANWHHLVPIYSGDTDAQGIVSIETGIGSLAVHVSDGTRMLEHLIDTRNCTFLELSFEEAIDRNDIYEDSTLYWTMTPPPAVPDKDYRITPEMQQAHEKHVRESEAVRMAYESTFQTTETFLERHKQELSGKDAAALHDSKRDYMAESRGNYPVLEAFLLYPDFTMEEKLLLLDSMHEKDMVDTPLSTLVHTLKEALPFRYSCPEPVFQRDLLSPRISVAMIEDNRAFLRQFLIERNVPFQGAAIWHFLKDSVTVLPKKTSGSRHMGSPIGALTHHVCDYDTFRLLFVSLCRAAGIPARMERRSAACSYYENGAWICPQTMNTPAPAVFPVAIHNGEEKTLHFFQDFLLEKYENGAFGFAPVPPQDLEGSVTLQLPEGGYRFVRMHREEDGSAKLMFQYFHVHGKRELVLAPLNKSQEINWICYPLCDGSLRKLYPTDASASIQSLRFWEELPQSTSVWMVLKPGNEPTEHILNEMLSSQEAYRTSSHQFCILLTEKSDLSNATLQKVLKAVPTVSVYLGDPQFLQQLYGAEPSGDIRLPFVVLVDSMRNIRYTWVGYRIGTADHILDILNAFSD